MIFKFWGKIGDRLRMLIKINSSSDFILFFSVYNLVTRTSILLPSCARIFLLVFLKDRFVLLNLLYQLFLSIFDFLLLLNL